MNKKEHKIASASLYGIKSSPRKIRSIVNIIRNKEIYNALSILQHCNKKKNH